MIILGIFEFILGIIFLGQSLVNSSCNGKMIIKALLGGFIITLGCSLIMIGIQPIIHDSTPEAIDVYRGKTTLQITYKDNIPTDTTVVYK